ncbi:MAG TPA: hypothetical protein VLK25_08290 [Allosphingosinicella sp.]|nr:hypothetical protein [Allosphingosinicella sp.]
MRHSILFLLTPLLAAAAVAPVTGAAAAEARRAALPAVTGLRYGEARTRLIRAGWRPAEQPVVPGNPDLASGNGPYFLARGYRELVACAGTGLAPCRFAFRNAGRMLVVVTAGEGAEARVRSARIEPGGRD